jgi:hypothetical protein
MAVDHGLRVNHLALQRDPICRSHGQRLQCVIGSWQRYPRVPVFGSRDVSNVSAILSPLLHRAKMTVTATCSDRFEIQNHHRLAVGLNRV